MWTEHHNPEGRTYWFNTTSRESVWEKPDELKSSFERALGKTQWKEYFSGGRKYYYNTETKVSKWDMPEELKSLLDEVEKEQSTSTAVAVPGALPAPQGASLSSSPTQANNTDNSMALALPSQIIPATGALPTKPNLPDDPIVPHNGFSNPEDGERAFNHLLRKAGVDPTWTWDQTMRAIITDPLFRSLATLAERKACWQKYVDNMRAKEQEEREARLAKLRPTLRNMLKGNPNVFHYTTFETADKLFAQHPTWQQGKLGSERKMIFEEYVTELKNREVQEIRAARTRATAKVVTLFKQLDVDVLTKWRTAYNMLLECEQYQQDEELQKLPALDILLAFEDYSRVREREYEEQMRRSQVEKTRRERKAREAFRELLQDLTKQGKIHARSKWKDVYPSFSNDHRYLDMLGNPGSNPLELFWDAVDTFDQKLDEKIAIVQEALARRKGEHASEEPALFTEGNTPSIVDFSKMVREDSAPAVQALSQNDIEDVYNDLQAVAAKKRADEKRRAERKQRHLQEDLRYALKKLSEPLDLSMSYESAVPLMEHLSEYQALDDEGRRAAFAKYVKRQKERMREAASEDGNSTTSRKRKEPGREDRERSSRYEKERERDGDKDYHSRSSRHHRSYDEYRRSSRDYEDRDKEPDDWDREYGRSRGYDRREYRKGGRVDYGRWDETSIQYDEPKEKRSADEDASVERAEKRPRYEDSSAPPTSARAETPEEGEI